METYKGYIIQHTGDYLVSPARTPEQVVFRGEYREDCTDWIDRQEKDRIALELSVFGPDDVSEPYLCFLDTWQGDELTAFLKTGCNPRLQPANFPGSVRRLSVKGRG